MTQVIEMPSAPRRPGRDDRWSPDRKFLGRRRLVSRSPPRTSGPDRAGRRRQQFGGVSSRCRSGLATAEHSEPVRRRVVFRRAPRSPRGCAPREPACGPPDDGRRRPRPAADGSRRAPAVAAPAGPGAPRPRPPRAPPTPASTSSKTTIVPRPRAVHDDVKRQHDPGQFPPDAAVQRRERLAGVGRQQKLGPLGASQVKGTGSWPSTRTISPVAASSCTSKRAFPRASADSCSSTAGANVRPASVAFAQRRASAGVLGFRLPQRAFVLGHRPVQVRTRANSSEFRAPLEDLWLVRCRSADRAAPAPPAVVSTCSSLPGSKSSWSAVVAKRGAYVLQLQGGRPEPLSDARLSRGSTSASRLALRRGRRGQRCRREFTLVGQLDESPRRSRETCSAFRSSSRSRSRSASSPGRGATSSISRKRASSCCQAIGPSRSCPTQLFQSLSSRLYATYRSPTTTSRSP